MMEGVESVLIKVLTTNTTDVTLKNEAHFKNCVIHPGPTAVKCLAEHGLAFSVNVIQNGENHYYLYDLGGVNASLLHNLNVFQISLARFKKVMISHGHYDHWGAILVAAERLPEGTEFILNPEGLYPRYSLKKDLTGMHIALDSFDFEELKRANKIRQLPEFPMPEFQRISSDRSFSLNTTNQPVELQPGVLTSGEIPLDDPDEVTKGMLIRKDGRFYHDTFRDELSLYIHVQDKGLVIITGCGHCGILNTIRHAQNLTGIDQVYAVIGGFHQNWAPLERIHKTIQTLQALHPTVISGMHCTGFRFTSECMHQMPFQTSLAVVGTTFIL